MSSLFNGYLTFDSFSDDAVKITFFKWLGQEDRSLYNLICVMQQRFNCMPFSLLDMQQLNVYMKVHKSTSNYFVAFEVVDNIVGNPIA